MKGNPGLNGTLDPPFLSLFTLMPSASSGLMVWPGLIISLGAASLKIHGSVFACPLSPQSAQLLPHPH